MDALVLDLSACRDSLPKCRSPLCTENLLDFLAGLVNDSIRSRTFFTVPTNPAFSNSVGQWFFPRRDQIQDNERILTSLYRINRRQRNTDSCGQPS